MFILKFNLLHTLYHTHSSARGEQNYEIKKETLIESQGFCLPLHDKLATRLDSNRVSLTNSTRHHQQNGREESLPPYFALLGISSTVKSTVNLTLFLYIQLLCYGVLTLSLHRCCVSTNILFTLKMCSSDLSHLLTEDNACFNLYLVK